MQPLSGPSATPLFTSDLAQIPLPEMLVKIHRYKAPGAIECRQLSQGIGLVLRRRFEPGTILFIEPADAAGKPPLFLLAQVVRATANGGGEWLLGCRFARDHHRHDHG